MQSTIDPPVEAREWLLDNPNPARSRPTGSTPPERALAFVDALYARGASEVLIDRPDVDRSGEPYADTLLVHVPPTGAVRHVEEFCEEKGPGDVPPGDFITNAGPNEIMLWWD
jgi:hypothetical protein